MDDIIKTIDNDMTPRFGHTLTLVCKAKGQENVGEILSDSLVRTFWHIFRY